MAELKNMATLPLEARARIEKFVLQLVKIHAENVVGIVVYGSAAGINFNPKTSDINLAVLFRTLDFEVFQKSVGWVAWGRKQNISAPLFLTENYVRSSLDVFPIEFNEIKNHHLCIYGQDIFTDLSIDAKHMRLLCEIQIKGKLLLIRQAYLASGGNVKSVRLILHDSLNGLFPAFRELVRLTGVNPSIHKEDLLNQLAAQCAMDVSTLTAIYRDKARTIPLPAAKITERLQDLLRQLERLAERIDQI